MRVQQSLEEETAGEREDDLSPGNGVNGAQAALSYALLNKAYKEALKIAIRGKYGLPNSIIPTGLHPKLHNKGETPTLGFQDLLEPVSHGQQPIGDRALCAQDSIKGRVEVSVPGLDKGQEKGLFALEMIIEGPLADASSMADLRHARSLVAALAETLCRGS